MEDFDERKKIALQMEDDEENKVAQRFASKNLSFEKGRIYERVMMQNQHEYNKTLPEEKINHLTFIEVEYDSDSKLRFTIIFDFIENEYFSNKHIPKRFNFHMGDLTSTESTPIDGKVNIPDIVPKE
ncbi:nucleosome assembly protein [Medicago truncatula]|uniref:Nucleosome assembly protein n=1 Tax=Medicago truncatula TaxID=3880 RepID=G7K3C0_MEDTR|nr:nucleosome assembly protein [Medicago truncatula]